MTPHGSISDMAFIEEVSVDFGSQTHIPLWRAISSMLAASVHFDFSKARVSQEHLDFGEQCLEAQCLVFPFQYVLYTGIGPKRGLLCGFTEPPANCAWQLTVIEFGPLSLNAAGINRVCLVPMLYVQVNATGRSGEHDEWVWGPMFNPGSTTRVGGEKVPAEDDNEEEWATQAFFDALAFTALLMSKDAEQTVETASEKMNRKREAAGKPLARDRHIVTIRPGLAQRSEAGDNQLGRRSPRMHWRRGHIRRVHNGTMRPIAPTIVNAAPGLSITPKKYEVTP